MIFDFVAIFKYNAEHYPSPVGFDDLEILQITLIASWFNYINRVADAPGIGRE